MQILKSTLLAVTLAFPALAQVQVQIQIPTITFGVPPALVVVQPGVQVVEDYDEEIFFVDNFYWVRRGPRWYRTTDYRGGWVAVDGRVPRALVRMPPGRYRHYRHGDHDHGHHGGGHGKHHRGH